MSFKIYWKPQKYHSFAEIDYFHTFDINFLINFDVGALTELSSMHSNKLLIWFQKFEYTMRSDRDSSDNIGNIYDI